MALHRQIRSIGHYRVTLGPSKLYLDDIQDVLSTVESFAKEHRQSDGGEEDGVIALIADKAIADSVEDLREATQDELSYVSIFLTKPYIKVDLWHRSADIQTDSDDPEARALADDLAAFINSKKARLRGYLPDFITPLFYFLYAAILLAIGAYHSTNNKPAGSYFASAIIVASLAALIFILNLTMDIRTPPHRIWIVAAKRSERKRISERTRREIMIGTIVAVIAAVIGAVVTRLLAK